MLRPLPTVSLMMALTLIACGDDTSEGSATTSGPSGTGGAATTSSSAGGNGTTTSSSSGGAGGTTSGGGGMMNGTGCPSTLPADWIFCEDFERGNVTTDVFFEHNDDEGDFVVVAGEGSSGDHSLEAVFQQSEVGAGWASVAFGRNPIVNNSPHHRPTEDFDEIYWRVMVKTQQGWPDVGPAKLSRATSFAFSNWGQAMIAHIWSGNGTQLVGDPASCVTGSTVNCMTYNDFNNLQWLGIMQGQTPIYASSESGRWRCVEAHVRLNTPGQNDGVFEFWIDGNLESQRNDLNWRGSYTDYGLNLVSFENYWNSGAVQDLKRWMDDMVVATVPIGCGN